MKLAPKDRLIVALDTPDLTSAQKVVEELDALVSIYKVGIELFTASGPEILKWLAEKQKRVFLDLKFHDIPRSVAQAAASALNHQVFMLNLHLLGGELMAGETVRQVLEISQKQKKKPPLIIGVTVLTSLADEDLKRIGIEKNLESLVLDLASMGKKAGLNGVVASAREAKKIKEKLGRDFLIVTPGIRPSGFSPGDQKRVLTPKEAVKAGADYLVVGRPVTGAGDMRRAARKILSEIEESQGC